MNSMKRVLTSCFPIVKELRLSVTETTKLFVGNVAPEVDEQILEEYVGKWAKVKNHSLKTINMVIDQQTCY